MKHTVEQLQAMSNRQLDAVVSEVVMRLDFRLASCSTGMDEAWLVVEHFLPVAYVQINNGTGDEWHCEIRLPGQTAKASASTPARAICIAAVLAVEAGQ